MSDADVPPQVERIEVLDDPTGRHRFKRDLTPEEKVHAWLAAQPATSLRKRARRRLPLWLNVALVTYCLAFWAFYAWTLVDFVRQIRA